MKVGSMGINEMGKRMVSLDLRDVVCEAVDVPRIVGNWARMIKRSAI